MQLVVPMLTQQLLVIQGDHRFLSKASAWQRINVQLIQLHCNQL